MTFLVSSKCFSRHCFDTCPIILLQNRRNSTNMHVRKKNDILLNLQNQKYNLRWCNRAMGDNVRSLIVSVYPEWVLDTRVCLYAYGSFIFYLKNNNYIKNKTIYDGMHKTGLNAKPQGWITWFHSAKSTVYNRYHRSREWFIRSAGAYNEGWRGEGSGGQDTRQSGNRVMIWFYSSVDEWCQSRGAADSWRISRSEQRLAWLHSPGAALCLARLHHHTLKSGFALDKFILSDASACVSLSFRAPTGQKKARPGCSN